MARSTHSRALIFLLAGGLSPLVLTQCKTTTAKTYKDVNYDSTKLKTPPGHGLDRNDYPFDESGAYRKDWVKNNTAGKDRSAVGQSSTTLASAGSVSSGGAPPSSGSASYPTYAEASASRTSGTFVGPAGASGGETADLVVSPAVPVSGETVLASASPPEANSTSQARYHKVNSGDTLFSLAGRYNTSVPEIKRVNGLSGDSIRTGQSLRIP